MGLPVEVNNLMLGSLGGYTVGRSLRFRSSASAYLNRTPASAGNRKTFTWSGWVKRGGLSSNYNLFSTWSGGGGATGYMRFNPDDTLDVFDYTGSAYTWRVNTTQVFRDPSAWYHLVIAVDTTQATSTNRVKIYVNGVQVSVFGTYTAPTQNADTYFNAAQLTYIGAVSTGSPSQYYDGYLAEVNFIDGQALTPSSFGAYDTNGVWQPKKYSGTYGTNGFYLPFNTNTAYGAAISGTGSTVNVNGSYTNLTLGTGNFTVEGWVYLNSTSSVGVIDWRPTSTNGNYPTIYISGGTLYYYVNSANVITSGTTIPTQTWTHIALARSGTTTKMFINGTQTGSSWSDSTNYLGATNRPGFGGAGFNGTSNGFDGYFSNLRIVKGTAVYTANFTPSTSPLTAITNTSLLTFNSATITDNSGNSVALTVGGTSSAVQFAPFGYNINSDQSGNGNNWNLNNISLINGTTYDSMVDSPTVGAGASNYAVLNPLDNNTTLTNGNLAVSAGANQGVTGTFGMPSGSWYWETTVSTVAVSTQVGIIATAQASSVRTLGTAGIRLMAQSNGVILLDSTSPQTGLASWANGDVIGCAFNAATNSMQFYRNGSTYGTAVTATSGYTYVPFCGSTGNTASFVANFGAGSGFSYTPPSGFKALNTYNLPAPSIANGAQYMAATLYTGTNSAQSLLNSQSNGGNNPLGTTFQPDWVWVKCRNTALSNSLYDSLRGVGNTLASNATNAANQEAAGVSLTAFNSNGFSVGTDNVGIGSVNASGATYVGWQWKAGGTGVTNNSGTITSTVSASPSSGFSIATYTGTGANATVGHGLGVAPSMVIVKQRSGANGWPVYHVSQTSAAYYMLLNQTDASNIAATVWNSTAPTSSVFSIGTAVGVNTSGQTYVAYCFSAVSGYSAFGKYTGNGSATDGPFIYTGFRPRFLILKRTDAIAEWHIIDSSRGTYNVIGPYLNPNTSDSEFNTSAWDFLSNGFKLRFNGGSVNVNGATYIYGAFAEHPFNYSRAR